MRFLSNVDARGLSTFLLSRSLICCKKTRLSYLLKILVRLFLMAWFISWPIIEMLDKLGLAVAISVVRRRYVLWSFVKWTMIGKTQEMQDVLDLVFLLKLHWYNLYLLTIVYLLFQILYQIWILNCNWHNTSLHPEDNHQRSKYYVVLR